MSEPDAVVTTSTAVNVETPEDSHDGVISEPSRWVANILWCLVVVTLCASVVGLTAAVILLAFTPKDSVGAADAATLVALLGTVLASLVGFYSARQRR